MTMSGSRRTCRARSGTGKVSRYLAFFIHLLSYTVVITVQMYSGFFAGEPFRFVMPMLAWGLGICLHGAKLVVTNPVLLKWFRQRSSAGADL